MTKQHQHEWGFMANPGSNGKGELAQCQVKTCRKWQYGDGKPFTMSYETYEKLHQAGEIDATEVLGPRKSQAEIKWWNVQVCDTVPGTKPFAYFRVRANSAEQAKAKATDAVRIIVWEA